MSARVRHRGRICVVSALALTMMAACAATSSPAREGVKPARVSSLRVVDNHVDARRWLAPDAARASGAGAGEMRILDSELVSEGDHVGAFVEIPAEECVLAFTRPSPTIVDVNLFAYEDDGSAFATDESPEPQAAILVCPPHPARLYVMARVMAGLGVLGIGVQPVPPAAADRVAHVMGVRGRPGEDSGRLDAWPGLERKLRAHREAVGGHWEDVRRLAMPVSSRLATRLSATVEAQRCLDVLVAPGDEVATMEVVIEDSDGRVLGRGTEFGRDRAIVACAGEATAVNVSIRPRGSQGLVAVSLARSALGGEGEILGHTRVVYLSQTLDLDARRRSVLALLAPLGYETPQEVGTGTARIGSRLAMPINLPPGCARLDILAGKPLSGVSATLWDERGHLLGEAQSGASAALFACGPGGPGRLDIEGLGTPGPFAVELRKDKSAPAHLLSHPLAAARLLARLNAGGEWADAAIASNAVAVSLDEASRTTLPVSTSFAGCVDVFAAINEGGAGLDLYLRTGSGEGSAARARYVVTERVCGAERGRPVVVELRLLAGKTTALVVTRPSK